MSPLSAIALILIGATGPSSGHESQITTEVRILDLNGLGWRSDVDSKLEIVTRQGGATIWTAHSEVLPELLKLAQNDCTTGCLQAPRVTTFAGAPCIITTRNPRSYIAGLGRVADGPVNHASTVSFQPDVRAVPEGARFQITCRPLDQGILAKVALDDICLLGMHQATVRETARNARGETPIQAEYQVPEVATCHVEGEWLIPKDGLLVMSLGVHTVKDQAGKAMVRERVAVVESKPMAVTSPPAQTAPVPEPLPEAPASASLPKPTLTWFVLPWNPIAPHTLTILPRLLGPPIDSALRSVAHQELMPSAAPASVMATRMPVIPSRMLPQGFTPDGRRALPPLPDEAVEPVSDSTSDEPRPTPQSQAGRAPGPPVLDRTNPPILDSSPQSNLRGPVFATDRLALGLAPTLYLDLHVDLARSVTMPMNASPPTRDQDVSPVSTDSRRESETSAPKLAICPGALPSDQPRRLTIQLPKWRKSIEMEIHDLSDPTLEQP